MRNGKASKWEKEKPPAIAFATPEPLNVTDGNERVAVVRYWNPTTERHEIEWAFWNVDPANATQIVYDLLGTLIGNERREATNILTRMSQEIARVPKKVVIPRGGRR